MVMMMPMVVSDLAQPLRSLFLRFVNMFDFFFILLMLELLGIFDLLLSSVSDLHSLVFDLLHFLVGSAFVLLNFIGCFFNLAVGL